MAAACRRKQAVTVNSEIAGVIADGILYNTLQELAAERAHCKS
jgi:hypothetical protein